MKNLIILSAVFCIFNQLKAMSKDTLVSQPVSEYAQKMINAIYASHHLKDEANKFKFHISYDAKMLPEKDVQDGMIKSKNAGILIASATDENDQPIIVISPGLNKWIELGTFDHGDEVIQNFAIYQLLSILGKHRYPYLPNITYDEKSMREYANKFAVQHMSLRSLEKFKQVLEDSVIKDSNFAEGLSELIGKEIQNRKK